MRRVLERRAAAAVVVGALRKKCGVMIGYIRESAIATRAAKTHDDQGPRRERHGREERERGGNEDSSTIEKENDIYACQDACVLDSGGTPTCEIAR